MIVRDQLQREIVIEKIPRRIVSLVPSQTELLCDLGLEDSLVGVTKFCVHPKNIRKIKTVVGGTKAVHFDKIAALDPEIILCNKEENTEEMVRELANLAPVHVSNVINYNDALDLVSRYGDLFGKQDITVSLIKDIEAAKKDFESEISKDRPKVVYLIWKKPWMAAGGDTFINSMLELNGCENVLRDSGRYPEIDLEELQSLGPDLVLLSSEPFPFKEKHRDDLEKRLKVKVQLVDGEYFSWYGSRMLPAFKYFKKFQMKLSSFL